MSSVVIDTDVFSYIFKRDSRARGYVDSLRDQELCISFMSVAELKRWAIQHRWGQARRQSLTESLRHYIVLAYDEQMTDVWAGIKTHRDRAGKPIETGDCWVAATAVRFGLPLVTHNRAHYEGVPNLQLITSK